MTKQEYAKQVARYLKCSPQKKREIEKQLVSDIEIALGEGRKLEEILEGMGEPKALAGEFNENLEEDGKKKPKRRIGLIVLAAVLAVLAVTAGIIYWLLPKTEDISKSRIFDEIEVKSRAEEIIRLYDAGDYETLYGYMSDEVLALLDETALDDSRMLICEDWGEFRGIGNVYMATVRQRGEEYAVVQMNVSYDNIGVTFTFSFDSDMQLYGFYIK